jgi:hypothetical protein
MNAGILSKDKIGNDYYLNIGMTVNGKNGNYQLWALEYTHQYHDYKDLRIPQETLQKAVTASFVGRCPKKYHAEFRNNRRVGYESINRGEAMLYDGAKILSEDNFIYGAGGRLTLKRTCQTVLY